jgi:glutamine amidotransferase
MIAIVDYGRGNLFSIAQSLRHAGAACLVTDKPEEILAAGRVILPGVGAFGAAMADLHARRLADTIREVARRGTPLLGICLGMEMLADESDEFGHHEGLGLIPGVVRRLPEGKGPDASRIPNVGWRPLVPTGRDPLFAGIDRTRLAYFVHSYGMIVARRDDISATLVVNGLEVAAAVRRDNVVGFQFHPEKSGNTGLELIRRFTCLQTLSSDGSPR